LLFIAEMAERLSTKSYMGEDEAKSLLEKFDALPEILTWGDYFAAEIATEHWQKSDAEFENICETVVFDFIAAIYIFTDKTSAFLVCARDEYRNALLQTEESVERDEKIHLGILEEYFTQMGLSKEKLNSEDTEFFDAFNVKAKSA
ncbi:MAG TPA: hypothetical protein PLY93_12775, partial [Turneriella sp.]|nr:hypothetical protein [Turneriella sp.]